MREVNAIYVCIQLRIIYYTSLLSIVERRPFTSCPPQSFARAAFVTIPFQSIEVLDVLE